VNFAPPDVSIDIINQTQNIIGEEISKVGSDYGIAGELSSGLMNIKDHLAAGIKITSITVTGKEKAKSGNAIIKLDNGVVSNSFPIGFGYKGLSSNWKSGNNNSPTGTFTLGKQRYSYSTTKKSIYSMDGKHNMGPAFISVDQGPYVGVGVHGKAEGNRISTTNGCIRVRNEDLVSFMKNIKPGITTITIQVN